LGSRHVGFLSLQLIFYLTCLVLIPISINFMSLPHHFSVSPIPQISQRQKFQCGDASAS
jgi:hypothetical protein